MSLFSNVQIYLNKSEKFPANGSVLVADSMVVKFNVVNGKDGLFVSLPRERYEREGEVKYSDKVYFTDKKVRSEFQDMVLEAYREKSGDSPGEDQTKGSNIPF